MFQQLIKKDGNIIAYHKTLATTKGPGIVYLGGFRSDMSGTKAVYLEEFCRKLGRSYIRFDYFGHGESS